jgi:RecB family exonuclease
MYESFKRLPIDGFDGAEVDVDTEPVEGIRIRGRVDAVFSDDDGVRIVDWKTGSFLDDSEPQLDFYAMAWRFMHGELPTAMEAISLKTGEKRLLSPTIESVGGTEDRVAAMIEDLRTAIRDRSELSRTAGPYCSWCPLLDDCNEGAAALEILDS